MSLISVIASLPNKGRDSGAVDPPPVVNEVNILISAGQSNKLGNTTNPPTGYTGVQSGVYIWTNAPFSDPDVYALKPYEWGVTSNRREATNPANFTVKFGWSTEAVAGKRLNNYTGNTTYIIKSAAGGQPISTWDEGFFMWTELSSYILNAIAAIEAANPGKTLKFRGMDWVQGEAEVVAGNSTAALTTRLASLIDRTRALDPRMANMPFFAFDLSVNTQTNVNPPGPGFTPTRAQVNAAMLAAVNSKANAYMINTDSLPNIGTEDGTHYTAAAYLSMGNAFYDNIILRWQ